MRYVGVDVSLKWLDVASVRGKKARYANTTEGIDTLVRGLPPQGTADGVHVILEPTSRSLRGWELGGRTGMVFGGDTMGEPCAPCMLWGARWGKAVAPLGP